MLSKFFTTSYRFPKSRTASLAVAAAITAAVGTLALAAPSQANTMGDVSLQFDGGYNQISSNTTTAGVVSEPYWNYQTDGTQDAQGSFTSVATSNGGTPNTNNVLLNSTGASSGVTYSYFYNRVSDTGGNDSLPAGSGDYSLAKEAAGVQSNVNATLTLSGLSGSYDIYAYVNPMYFSGSGTLEEVGLGSTNYYLSSSSSLTSWVRSTNTTDVSVPASNYVEFTGLSGATQTITVFANGNAYGLDGIQIIPSAVPEPATLGLMAVAGAGILLLKRRSSVKA